MFRLPLALGLLLLTAAVGRAQLSTVTSGSALEASASTPAPRPAPQRLPPAPPLATPPPSSNTSMIALVNLPGVPARRAFEWLSAAGGVNIVIDWAALQAQGFDPQTPISLELRNVSFQQVLDLLVQQLQPPSTPNESQLVYEEFPGFIQVLTKAQANQRLVVRTYEIAEMTVTIPSFHNAPQMDLASVLGSGGSQGGGVSFQQTAQAEPAPTQADRGEQVAQMIRDMVEPAVWQQNGGPASVRYFQGRLVVNAPMYVHRQIGAAVPGPPADPAAGRYVGFTGGIAITNPPSTRVPSGTGVTPVSPPPGTRSIAGIGAVDRTPSRPIVARER